MRVRVSGTASTSLSTPDFYGRVRVRVRVRVSGTAPTSLSTPDFYDTTMHGRATTTQYSLGTHLPLSVSGSPASSDWRDAG